MGANLAGGAAGQQERQERQKNGTAGMNLVRNRSAGRTMFQP
jgi:hypothetical protein